MYSTYNPVASYSTKNSECCSENSEKLLNSKIFYLNNSSSKFVCVGIGLNDFLPQIVIGGQNSFKIFLNEEEWKSLLQYQGVLVNYFSSFDSYTTPVQFGNITIYFEKFNQCPILKIQKNGGQYICLSGNSMEKLWELQEIIDYRIEMIKKQEFQKYFSIFQSTTVRFDLFQSNIYNIINPHQNPNSENVSTMLELLTYYPNELENKLRRNGPKRKFYEEISDFQ